MITNIQIDTNANCGSKCWYCPVRFTPRPRHDLMTTTQFERIINEILDCISKNLIISNYSLWLSSYNDVLLDPLFEDKLKVLRKYNLRFPVLTNGIGLLNTFKMLDQYRDVICGYSVNLPAGNAQDYSRFTLNPNKVFDQIISGLLALYNLDPEYYTSVSSVNVNGAFDDELARIQLNFYLPLGDTNKQINQLRSILPFKIYEARPLCDRAGNLSPYSIDNTRVRHMWVQKENPKGCTRLNEWIHINSNCQVYTCCQDYNEKHIYGDLKTVHLYDILKSSNRIEANKQTISNLCKNCIYSR
jgi:sulfatase maturation enzyme AslB (radical SAM superfamily)